MQNTYNIFYLLSYIYLDTIDRHDNSRVRVNDD